MTPSHPKLPPSPTITPPSMNTPVLAGFLACLQHLELAQRRLCQLKGTLGLLFRWSGTSHVMACFEVLDLVDKGIKVHLHFIARMFSLPATYFHSKSHYSSLQNLLISSQALGVGCESWKQMHKKWKEETRNIPDAYKMYIRLQSYVLTDLLSVPLSRVPSSNAIRYTSPNPGGGAMTWSSLTCSPLLFHFLNLHPLPTCICGQGRLAPLVLDVSFLSLLVLSSLEPLKNVSEAAPEYSCWGHHCSFCTVLLPSPPLLYRPHI